MEKAECIKDYTNNCLRMNDEKCKPCEYYYQCRFIMMTMYEVFYGE